MDLIFASTSESPSLLFSAISKCDLDAQTRIYVYVSVGDGRSNSLKRHRHVRNASEWERVAARYKADINAKIVVAEVPNVWSGTEATAYMLHIVTRYADLARKSVFMHGHDSSWHSARVCALVQRARRSTAGFENLNNNYQLRCMSPRGVYGAYTSLALRDWYYSHWLSWTLEAPPKRIVFQCCAQFVAQSSSIRKRQLNAWTQMLDAIVHSRMGNNWEYLWPTLIDESLAVEQARC